MLQDPRPGHRTVLGHVPDQDHRDIEALRELHDRAGRLADLAHGARRAGHPLGVEGLDRVDHAGMGPLRLEGGEERLDGGLRQGGHREGSFAEPLGAQPDLRRGLLA